MNRALAATAVLISASLVSACGGGGEQAADAPDQAPAAAAQTAMKSPEELEQMHCVRCHLAPEPEDLSREYWSFAMHYMGNYVGMKGDEFEDMRTEPFPPEYEPVKDYTKRYFLYDSNGYFRDLYPFRPHIPPEPLMTKDEWLSLREYYTSRAKPWQEMEMQGPKPPITETFRAVTPELELEPNTLVLATFVDTESGHLYVGRSVIDDWVGGGERREGFEEWDDVVALDIESGERIGYTRVASDPIDMMKADGGGVRVLEHGRFPMTEVGLGRIVDYKFKDDDVRTRMLVDGWQRSVQFHRHDMNGDGLDDFVANAFGDGIFLDANSELTIFYATPKFAELLENAPSDIEPGVLPGALRQDIIARDAGLIGSAVADFNNDGLPDVAAVVAQGRQEVQLYINKGDETFEKKVIAEYRPSHGGNSLRAADFDGDGNVDLVVINGDNVAGNHVINVVPAPRPQHGIRVWKNNGDLEFTEEYFYRMHGAIRSVVDDFDSDGDPDVAVIALFPQWSYDEPESFVYLENKGDFGFEPQSIPTEFFGVWTSIEAADVNGDSKQDIVLGLGNFPELVPPDWLTNHPAMEGRGGEAASVIYLLNKSGEQPSQAASTQ
jgi:hypothetical protein